MGNYTPNPFMIQPIYYPTRPFATPTYDQGKEFMTNNIYFIPIKLKVFIILFII